MKTYKCDSQPTETQRSKDKIVIGRVEQVDKWNAINKSGQKSNTEYPYT